MFGLWIESQAGPVLELYAHPGVRGEGQIPAKLLRLPASYWKTPDAEDAKTNDHRSVRPLYPQLVANKSLIKTDRLQFRGTAGQGLVD